MDTIHVRGIDEALKAALKREAGHRGTSMNTLIIETLRRELGLATEEGHRTRHHELDHLAGTWDTSAVEEFAENTAEFEQVEDELWRTSAS